MEAKRLTEFVFERFDHLRSGRRTKREELENALAGGKEVGRRRGNLVAQNGSCNRR